MILPTHYLLKGAFLENPYQTYLQVLTTVAGFGKQQAPLLSHNEILESTGEGNQDKDMETEEGKEHREGRTKKSKRERAPGTRGRVTQRKACASISGSAGMERGERAKSESRKASEG